MNVAINGLGRIGRATLKILLERSDIRLVAINDLVPGDNLAYLLNYDSVYGRYSKRVEAVDGALTVDGKRIALSAEKDPGNLLWGRLGVDIVFECTGAFLKHADLAQHIKAGASRVILSAPPKGDDIPTIVYGVNEDAARGSDIISCASCTTNCITPLIEVMGRRVGIRKATLTTIHAYTVSQSIVDSPNRHWERGRAGAMNFVPTTTGAAKATTKALPQYKGKFDGLAVRGPVAVGSLADVVCVTSRPTSVEEVNSIFEQEASTERYRNVLAVSQDPIVSSDIIQQPYGSVVDLALTQVIDGDLVKLLSWYDNEWGYAHQMVQQAAWIATHDLQKVHAH
jgi:glyceraldehyde 3-phosphate dehydrogenase